MHPQPGPARTQKARGGGRARLGWSRLRVGRAARAEFSREAEASKTENAGCPRIRPTLLAHRRQFEGPRSPYSRNRCIRGEVDGFSKTIESSNSKSSAGNFSRAIPAKGL